MDESQKKLAKALWRIFRRPDRPRPWENGGNLPWSNPVFSERMLREHLDESHGAASRNSKERNLILEWLWKRLALQSSSKIIDITCGPGLYAVELAKRGSNVIGIDFSPAAIRHARMLSEREKVSERCTFVEQDILNMSFPPDSFDATLFLYGQLAVFPIEDAQSLLEQMALLLKPGGKLVVELLDQNKIDKKESNWWFTDEQGLWGSAPFLHLGERFWLAEEAMSIERYHILHLDSGGLEEITLCDQSYTVQEMVQMLIKAGFSAVDFYPAWDDLPLYDAGEWNVYIARTDG